MDRAAVPARRWPAARPSGPKPGRARARRSDSRPGSQLPEGTAAEGGRADWLRAGDQVDVRTQVPGGEVDDVVALLAQRSGDGPVPVGADVQQDRPDPQILDFGDHRREVFLGAHDDRVADRVVAREGTQVLADLGLDAFLAVRPRFAQPELHAGDVSERLVLLRATALGGRVVPVAPQQRQAGTVPGQAAQQLQQPCVFPGHRVSIASAVNSQRALGEHIACVHEQRAAIQRDTVLSLRVTLPAHRGSRDT